jgi:hypothetical protein
MHLSSQAMWKAEIGSIIVLAQSHKKNLQEETPPQQKKARCGGEYLSLQLWWEA